MLGPPVLSHGVCKEPRGRAKPCNARKGACKTLNEGNKACKAVQSRAKPCKVCNAPGAVVQNPRASTQGCLQGARRDVPAKPNPSVQRVQPCKAPS